MGNCFTENRNWKIQPQNDVVDLAQIRSIDVWYFWMKVSKLEAEFFETQELVELFFEHSESIYGQNNDNENLKINQKQFYHFLYNFTPKK